MSYYQLSSFLYCIPVLFGIEDRSKQTVISRMIDLPCLQTSNVDTRQTRHERNTVIYVRTVDILSARIIVCCRFTIINTMF